MNVPAKGRPDPRHREPLWDRVDHNRLKLALYVSVFVLVSTAAFDAYLLLFGGCLLLSALRNADSPASGLLAGFGSPAATMTVAVALVAVGWASFTLLRSERWLLSRLGAVFVPKGELLETKMALKDMAIAAGLPVAPALYLLDTDNVNAFVFAAHSRRAVIGVTRGLVDRLSICEQRAVFANLIARLVSGDTIVATGVTALVWPLHAWREGVLVRQNRELDDATFRGESRRPEHGLLLLVFGAGFAILAELVAAGHRVKQLRAAEKADAEGMLLLKDPIAMLHALEKCVRYDNVVPIAGEAFSDLFYCWTGDSTDDEDDPEWERVARLREVLGVEGFVPDDATAPAARSLAPPPPPRLADRG